MACINLVTRVRDLLADVSDVSEKKMFGSLAFMVRGKMCVTAREERLMCRIAPALHQKSIKRKGCTTVVMRGRQYQGYVYIDADSVKSKQALKSWIQLALSYNEELTCSD
ncbi:TfoX/Sxy family protein [Novipirellula caenicola]|uniref:TfoX N-terminal domain-containing protein n=1 Tax=Novipirellula caenicola TaxID=1536901 RepID=A0ABP9VPE0_9BACT